MDGFVTLAIGERYLQMAAAFALSARRFGYETIVMVPEAVPREYSTLFADTFPLEGRPTANEHPVYAIWEMKRYAYEASARFSRCAFVDADSLMVRNPQRMFAELAREQPIHTPGGRAVRRDEAWAAPHGITARQAAEAMGVPAERAVQTLNGGFLFWQRGPIAERWFTDYGQLFGRLSKYFETRRGKRCAVSDELCAAIAIARAGIGLRKSDTSIGVWDASQLQLDMGSQQFRCVKHYYWEGHAFQPYIAHFGSSRISRLYRQCAKFVRNGSDMPLPVFDEPEVSHAAPPSRLPANPYSLSDDELRALRKFIDRHKVQSVLEFGPGRSTECLLDAGCQVVSLEYDSHWLAHYRSLFANQPRLKLGAFENREPVTLPDWLPQRFDLALVDSPRGDHAKGGCSRLNTCLAAAAHADLILLHDVNRQGERATIEQLRTLGWTCEPVPEAPKLAALRRPSAIPIAQRATAPGRDYDLSHWPAPPRVSCQCITYGRTALLDEAVESFLRQDYRGWKELVILNDLPSLTLRFDHPQVKVVNLPARLRSIGEKRNACVALCAGDVIFPWDDDDISLPHRISYSLQQMANHRYFKPDRMWTWRSGGVFPAPKPALAHAMGCWSRELFNEVGGYPHLQSGQDAALEHRFEGRGRTVERTPLAHLFYVYRYAETASYHLSAYGYDRGYAEVARYVHERNVRGVYDIKPAWTHDYSALVAQAVTQLTAAATGNASRKSPADRRPRDFTT
jgi:hypothetical protein